MSRAIVTRYIPASNTKGSRIVAEIEYGQGGPLRATIPFPHELSGEDCYRTAAEALRAKLKKAASSPKDWGGRLIGGGLPNGTGYAFVFAR